ncbi:MAG: DUF5655 domain-containing protein [Pyrinomonadaceae bacterium]
MPRVEDHFAGKQPVVRDMYDTLLAISRKWGRIEEDPKKTSIHLNRTSAFAGVATGKAHLTLTLKSKDDIPSPRIKRREQTSASRWHCEIKLTSNGQIDRELIGWLRSSYDLS